MLRSSRGRRLLADQIHITSLGTLVDALSCARAKGVIWNLRERLDVGKLGWHWSILGPYSCSYWILCQNEREEPLPLGFSCSHSIRERGGACGTIFSKPNREFEKLIELLHITRQSTAASLGRTIVRPCSRRYVANLPIKSRHLISPLRGVCYEEKDAQ